MHQRLSRASGARKVSWRRSRSCPGEVLRHIVVTRDPAWRDEGAERAASLEEALALAGDVPRVFVIGGAAIFDRALPLADELELTEVDAEFAADTFFPPWNRAEFRQTSCESHATPEGLVYRYASYRRTTPGE